MLPLPMFFIVLYMLYLFNINVNLKNQIIRLQENNNNEKYNTFENNKNNSMYDNNKNPMFEYKSEYLYFPQFHPELIQM